MWWTRGINPGDYFMPPDDTLPAVPLVRRLAVREPDRLRPLSGDDDHGLDIAARGWEQHAETWAARMEPGDELWTWSSPRWTWENLCGRGGLAIVRDGKPVDYAMTVMN
jgi:hypothetical protein